MQKGSLLFRARAIVGRESWNLFINRAVLRSSSPHVFLHTQVLYPLAFLIKLTLSRVPRTSENS